MNAAKFLPFENYTLVTKLTVADVCERISENVEPKRTFRSLSFKATTKPYEGEIKGYSFSISRIIGYRNSFLPMIKGHVSSFINETHIEIKMRPFVFVIIFMSFWLGIVGLVSLGILTVALMNIKKFLYRIVFPSLATLVPFIMFAFGYALVFFAFKFESKNQRNIFNSY